MKLEEGMYVRTKEFGIQKIKWFDNEEPILENGFTALQKAGYKASHNIIDLIEEGDYVNGMRVNNIAIEDGIIFLHMDADDCLHEDTMLTGDDIKSIVTKEQFESVSYKMEGKC